MGKQNVAQALEWAVSNANVLNAGETYSNGFDEAIYNLAQIDSVATFDALALSKSSPSQQQLLATVLARVAQADPIQALSRLERIKDERAKKSGLAQILNGWIEVDSVAAVDYLVDNADDIDKSSFYLSSSVASSLSKADALRLLEATHHDGYLALQSQTIQTVLGQDVVQGLNELEAQYGDQPFFNSLRIEAVKSLAYQDLAQAEQYILGLPKAGTRSKGLMELVNVAASIDPNVAARLALEIGHERTQQEAITNLTYSWAKTSSKDAKRWISSLDDSQRDVATEAFVNASPDPIDELFSMADDISDTSIKERAYTGLLHLYALDDHKKAQRLMAKLDFMSPTSKQAINTLIQECVLEEEEFRASHCRYYRNR